MVIKRYIMDLAKISDEILIEKIRTADKELFREIVRRYQRKLIAYLFCMVGNNDDAQDLAQKTFIKAYENLFDFRMEKKFSSWIYRIAHNEAVNHLKRKSLKNFVPIEEAVHISENGGENNTEKNIDEQILRQKVKKYISRLKLKYREPIILHFYEEKTYQEISDILRLPASTVSTLISRGRKMIEELYLSDNKI